MAKSTKTNYIILWALGFAILGVATYFIIEYNITANEKTFLNKFFIISSIASCLGIIITFIQFLYLRKTVTETKEEVNKVTSQIEKTLTVSEISRAIKTIAEIKTYLQNNNLQAAELRMQDLRPILIQLKNTESFKQNIGKSKFNNIFSDFNIDINNINSYLLDKEFNIETNIINKHLEYLLTILIEIDGNIKTFNYE